MGPDHLFASPRTALRWIRSWRPHGRHRVEDWTPLDEENAVTHAQWNDLPPFDDPEHTNPEGTYVD